LLDLPVVSDYETASARAENEHLRVGLVPGVYADMFAEVIQPFLEELGYTVERIYYDNYELPNNSLARDLIDFNIFQHYKSLNNFKFENDLALSAIAEIPTIPMNIFSLDYESLEDVEHGAVVSLPFDQTNRARALLLLEDARIIKLDKSIDKTRITEDDIIYNPFNIRINTLRPENLVQSLSICSLSVIDGNYAQSGGLNIADAIYSGFLEDDHLIVVAIRTEDLNSHFARDLLSILNSDEYKRIIKENEKFANYQHPRSWREIEVKNESFF